MPVATPAAAATGVGGRRGEHVVVVAEHVLEHPAKRLAYVVFGPVAENNEVDVFTVTAGRRQVDLVQECAAPHRNLAVQKRVIEQCRHRPA